MKTGKPNVLVWWKKGDAWIWVNGAAVAVSIIAVMGLLLLLAVKGLGHFWPDDILETRYRAPGADAAEEIVLIGEIVDREMVSGAQLVSAGIGVKDVREVIEQAKTKPGAILFIDEIHRFNKGQQDALLGAVEKGIITLIGATTENPSFEVNSALLSRCQVYVLKSLNEEQLIKLLQNAINKDEILKSKSQVLLF